MFIRSIHLTDFCNVQSERLTDLADAVTLFGFNGQGKSTFIYALQMLLFGYCDRTDKRGSGSAELIRDGAKKAEIACEIEVTADLIIRVFLIIKRKGANEWGCCIADTGEVIDGVDDRAGLWQRLGISMEHARVAAFPMQMLRSKELSDPLADYLASDLDLKRLKSLCGDHYDWLTTYAKGQAGTPVYSGLTGLTLTGTPVAAPVKLEASHFEDLGQRAFDRRRDLKRELQSEKYLDDAGGDIAPPKDGNGQALTVEQIPALETQLTRMQARIEELCEALGAAKSAPDATEIAERRAAADQALTDAIHADAIASAAHDQLAAELRTRKGEVEAAERALGVEKNASVNADHQMVMKRKELATLEAPKANCLTCGQPLTDAITAEIIGPRKAEIARLEAEHAAALAKHDEILATLTPLREVVKAVSEKAERAATESRNAAIALERAKAACESIPLPYDGPSVGEIEPQIATLREQLARGEEKVATLRKIAEQAENRRFIENAEREVKQLDWCVKAFKDGEILNQLLGSPIDDFTARCNVELSPMGYELSIVPQGKQLAPMLRCPGNPTPRPVMNCSAGQQTLAAVAIASAFADTGAPVLLDDLNQLDPANRGKVLMRMRAAAAGSVVCAATWQQKPEDAVRAAGALAPVAVFWVDGGCYAALDAAVTAEAA